MQPREISISLKIAQSRLIPTLTQQKEGLKEKREVGKVGGISDVIPMERGIKKSTEAVIFRNSAMGFNDCPDEKRSDIRIAGTVCNMNRDVSTIALIKKGIKANKVIITSRFVLFFTVAPPQKGQKGCPQISNDNIVHPVSTVIK